MVPSGKGIEGLFQRARAAVAPVSVCTCGAPVLEAAEEVSARLAALTDVVFTSTASGKLAFFALALVSDAASDAVVVCTS